MLEWIKDPQAAYRPSLERQPPVAMQDKPTAPAPGPGCVVTFLPVFLRLGDAKITSVPTPCPQVRSEPYRQNNTAVPRTVTNAPHQACHASRLPVRSQSIGRMATGAIDESVDATATLVPVRAIISSDMPTT